VRGFEQVANRPHAEILPARQNAPGQRWSISRRTVL